MAHRQFLVLYPDGSRKHVDREERDSLLYSQEIKEVAPKQYRYVARMQSFRCSATENTLEALATAKTVPPIIRHLGLSVIFQLGDKRKRETEESTGHMEIRLRREGLVA